MRQKYILGVGVLFLVLLISGCATKIPPVNSQNGNNNQRGMMGVGNVSSTFNNFLQNTTTSTVADLLVGKKVLVFGTTNSDNSLNATQIIIGDLPNFRPDQPSQRPTTNRPSNSNGQGGSRPQGQMMGGRSGGANMVSGEIFKKDDTSLIIKNDNGSRIVFYSDKTAVYTANPMSNTN